MGVLNNLNNEYFYDHLFVNNNGDNNINNLINNKENKIFNEKIKSINREQKIKFKDSDDIIIKIIYHTIPEAKQLKMYL